ncbi:hypothetical protein COO60DRAFT_1165291 [Scenedesmus sp. NREL 46B-D3]|nr:hypothetical protein COO60DRAFT_1165291 [Scenedesmus sp. NREL 46B-D3]
MPQPRTEAMQMLLSTAVLRRWRQRAAAAAPPAAAAPLAEAAAAAAAAAAAVDGEAAGDEEGTDLEGLGTGDETSMRNLQVGVDTAYTMLLAGSFVNHPLSSGAYNRLTTENKLVKFVTSLATCVLELNEPGLLKRQPAREAERWKKRLGKTVRSGYKDVAEVQRRVLCRAGGVPVKPYGPVSMLNVGNNHFDAGRVAKTAAARQQRLRQAGRPGRRSKLQDEDDSDGDADDDGDEAQGELEDGDDEYY